jgi:hypothetical protein
MSDLPFGLKVALVAVMVAALGWGFFGRPPESRDARGAALYGAVGLLLGLVSVQRLYTEQPDAVAFITGAVVAASLAVWHVRGEAEDEDGGQGVRAQSPDGPRPGPVVDWDAFDRARRGWDRPHVNA